MRIFGFHFWRSPLRRHLYYTPWKRTGETVATLTSNHTRIQVDVGFNTFWGSSRHQVLPIVREVRQQIEANYAIST